MKFYVFIALVLMVFAGACKKKDTETVSTADVKIEITSPVEGALYHAGDSIHVVAAISFNGVLHGYEINVTDTATGGVIFDADEHAHKDTFMVNQTFVASGTNPVVLRLRLVTEIDHNGDIAEKQVYFRYQP